MTITLIKLGLLFLLQLICIASISRDASLAQGRTKRTDRRIVFPAGEARTFFEVLVNGVFIKVLRGNVYMIKMQAVRGGRCSLREVERDQACLLAVVFNSCLFTGALNAPTLPTTPECARSLMWGEGE